MKNNTIDYKKVDYWEEISLVKSLMVSIILSILVLLLDIEGIPLSYINRIGVREACTVIGLIVIFVILFFYRGQVIELMKIPFGNVGDEFLWSLFFSCLIIAISEFIIKALYVYKLYILSLVLLMSFISIIMRYMFCKVKKQKVEQANRTELDLYTLLLGNVKCNDLPVVFSEKASDRDLLGRAGLVNFIFNSIWACNPDSVYVIGLKGAWGCGKTTILNIVKERIKLNWTDAIVIDNFDPWVFGTQDALLSAMYEEILSKTGIHFSSHSNRVMLQKLKEIVTDNNKVTSVLGNIIEFESNEQESVYKLKNRIGSYLKKLGRTVVFIIDNIDRAETDNILFLFKLIGSVFDLPNMVYILAYDEERINKVFEDTNKVNPKYIEKIVQQEVVIPEIPQERIENVCFNCVVKVLGIYGVTDDELVQYREVIQLICKSVINLRQLKRLFNTSFGTTFCYDNMLYKPHLLAVEVIRFFEPELYDQIKIHGEYFVSISIYIEEYRSKIANVDRFNEDGKRYYDELFERFGDYKDLLATLFPYVERYKIGADLREKYVYFEDSSNHNHVASVANSKYFDLYFSYGTNDFLRILTYVDDFIEAINNANHKESRQITERAIENIELEEQREWFERLENKIDELDKSKWKYVIEGICYSLEKLDTTPVFGFLSSEQRAILVVTKLLKGLESSIIKEIVDNCSYKHNIDLWKAIADNCTSYVRSGNHEYDRVRQIVMDKYHELCNEIIERDIDIYIDSIYKRRKVWSLYNSIPEENKDIMHIYMTRVLTKTNVFRVLSDIISQSVGTEGYGYYIDEENITKLFGEKEILEHVVEQSTPSNEVESFVLGVWERMMTGEKKSYTEKQIYFPIPQQIEI